MAFEWLHSSLRQLGDVRPAEVHEALASDRRWPRLARDGEFGRAVLTIWARTRTGRPLVIATRKRTAWAWQCLGARTMHDHEVREFEAWEHQRVRTGGKVPVDGSADDAVPEHEIPPRIAPDLPVVFSPGDVG